MLHKIIEWARKFFTVNEDMDEPTIEFQSKRVDIDAEFEEFRRQLEGVERRKGNGRNNI